MSKKPNLSPKQADAILGVIAEQSARSTEALRLFRPLPTQMPFFQSLASERLVRGGNRSGKSVSAAVAFASAVTGIPLVGWDEKPLPSQWIKKGPTLAWVVNYDQRYIGDTTYRLLFRPGAFSIIQDAKTKEWRAYRPWQKDDVARKAECKPAPPLIPKRLIDQNGWAWENKAGRVFSVCRLTDGTEIHAFSSKGDVKMGDPVDIIWIDEALEYPTHVAEYQARLSDRQGRLWWSSFPNAKNEALISMSERAADQHDRENPDVHETLITFEDNPYIDADEKRKRREGWSDEEWRARNSGEFLEDTVLVYPNYSIDLHGTPARDKANDDEVDKILRERSGQPPEDWTRYLALDPGHTVCAVLFMTVPPPELSDCRVVYDELYLKSHDADDVAKAVATKCGGYGFEAFLIDYSSGKRTPEGFDITVKTRYSEAFQRHGLRSRLTGHDFAPGNDNVRGGIELVREWLSLPTGKGRPKLRIYRDNTRNLQKEFGRYKKVVRGNEITDDIVKKHDHAMDSLRYLVCYDPEYYLPTPMDTTPSAAYRQFREWKEAQDAGNSKSIYLGAGTPT